MGRTDYGTAFLYLFCHLKHDYLRLKPEKFEELLPGGKMQRSRKYANRRNVSIRSDTSNAFTCRICSRMGLPLGERMWATVDSAIMTPSILPCLWHCIGTSAWSFSHKYISTWSSSLQKIKILVRAPFYVAYNTQHFRFCSIIIELNSSSYPKP